MLMPSIFRDNFVDDLFKDMIMMPMPFRKGIQEQPNLMKTDVKEHEDKYQLDLELPGFEKENITAELKDGYLTVRGAFKEKTIDNSEHPRYIRKERFSGSCERQFYVGDGISQEDIKASFNNGVLTILIPKKEEKPELEEKKYIAIE